MRLNHETVREVLLYLEDNLQLNDELDAANIQIPEVTTEEIIYTLEKLLEASFISARIEKPINNFPVSAVVYSITWKGHEFIDNIRDEQVWKYAKKSLSRFSTVSISFISSVAAEVISSMIKQTIKAI